LPGNDDQPQRKPHESDASRGAHAASADRLPRAGRARSRRPCVGRVAGLRDGETVGQEARAGRDGGGASAGWRGCVGRPVASGWQGEEQKTLRRADGGAELGGGVASGDEDPRQEARGRWTGRCARVAKLGAMVMSGEYFWARERLTYRPNLSSYPRHRGRNMLVSVSFVS
jgi:hypothetical protein